MYTNFLFLLCTIIRLFFKLLFSGALMYLLLLLLFCLFCNCLFVCLFNCLYVGLLFVLWFAHASILIIILDLNATVFLLISI